MSNNRQHNNFVHNIPELTETSQFSHYFYYRIVNIIDNIANILYSDIELIRRLFYFTSMGANGIPMGGLFDKSTPFNFVVKCTVEINPDGLSFSYGSQLRNSYRGDNES